jgi:hypothetical protein
MRSKVSLVFCRFFYFSKFSIFREAFKLSPAIKMNRSHETSWESQRKGKDHFGDVYSSSPSPLPPSKGAPLPSSQDAQWEKNKEFMFALTLLRADVVALCLRAGVPPSSMWPPEAILLNLDVLRRWCQEGTDDKPGTSSIDKSPAQNEFEGSDEEEDGAALRGVSDDAMLADKGIERDLVARFRGLTNAVIDESLVHKYRSQRLTVPKNRGQPVFWSDNFGGRAGESSVAVGDSCADVNSSTGSTASTPTHFSVLDGGLDADEGDLEEEDGWSVVANKA